MLGHINPPVIRNHSWNRYFFMINIAIALNKNLLLQSCILLASIAVNNPDEAVRVYVLHSELTDEDIELMQKTIDDYYSYQIIPVFLKRNLFSDLPEKSYWSLEAYYRLMLTDILPDDVSRILYLDIDIIVNKNISNFYASDFKGSLLISSEDPIFDPSKQSPVVTLFEDKIDDGFKYFCSGMILYDIAGLRQKNYTFKKYIKVFSDISDKVECPDQDLLNYIHWRDVKLVDNSKYGVFAKTAHLAGRTYSDLKENAAIIHYAGPNKPWTVNLTSYDIEKIWWEYAKITPFYYQLLEQVFYNHLDSSFTEDFIRKLNDENNELKNIIFKMNEVFRKMQ